MGGVCIRSILFSGEFHIQFPNSGKNLLCGEMLHDLVGGIIGINHGSLTLEFQSY